MEAVILAGGFGTRLREVVADVPKPMAPVSGRPFLEIVLSVLSRQGFRRVVLSLGYMAETIVSHFGGRYKKLELVYEIEDSPLGTGGAVRAALQQCHNDHVYIFNGDTFLDLEVSQVEAVWQRNHHPVIVAREVLDTARYGRLHVTDGLVTGFAEKGVVGPGLINAGCYALPLHCLDAFEVGRRFSLETDYFMCSVPQLHIDAFVTKGHFIDIGVPEDYMRAQTELTPFAL